MSQGFQSYERLTDTRLARAAGEKNLGQKIAEGFQGTKTLPQTIGEGFPKRKNLGAKMSQGFRAYQGGRGKKRNPPQFFGEGFRSAEGPTSRLPGSQGKIEAMRMLLKRFSPYDPLEV